MKPKIAFVIQRYGLDVVGGSELLCRWTAERLTDEFDIEVLTTCAKDYITWKNEYSAGKETINNVIVHRFKVDKERNIKKFNRFSNKIFSEKNISTKDEIKWVHKQGPQSSGLIECIEQNKDVYDYFIFFTYLYFTTVFGLPLVADKGLLVPTAHDEPPIKLNIYKEIFHSPKALIFNTVEERDFVHNYFNNKDIKNQVIGTGVSLPKNTIDPKQFTKKYDLDNFILYAGRIEEGKGLTQLFDYYLKYINQAGNQTKLVLIGQKAMEIPKNPNIIYLGYVSDKDKFDAIAASKLVVAPSPLESFSIISTEAWLLKRPILVNGNSPVLVGHCNRSKGGLYYKNFKDFKKNLDQLLSNAKLQEEFGKNGFKYINDNYSWPIIIEKYSSLLNSLNN